MRKQIMPIIIIIILMAIYFMPAPGYGDVFMKEKVKREGFQMMGQSQPGSDMIRSTWITTEKMRSDDDQQSIIVRLDKKVFYIVKHDEKKYMEMPMDLMGKQMEKTMEKEGMSEDDMQKYMGMAKGMMKMKITVTPTREKKKIGDWNCQKYIQKLETMMGPTTSEVWATEDLKMDYNLYAKFSSALLGQQPGAQQMMGDMVEELKKIKGVPVLTSTTVNMMGSTMTSSQELLEFKEGTAPSGIFELPKGYKKENWQQ
jgi:hypothetical protein